MFVSPRRFAVVELRRARCRDPSRVPRWRLAESAGSGAPARRAGGCVAERTHVGSDEPVYRHLLRDGRQRAPRLPRGLSSSDAGPVRAHRRPLSRRCGSHATSERNRVRSLAAAKGSRGDGLRFVGALPSRALDDDSVDRHRGYPGRRSIGEGTPNSALRCLDLSQRSQRSARNGVWRPSGDGRNGRDARTCSGVRTPHVCPSSIRRRLCDELSGLTDWGGGAPAVCGEPADRTPDARHDEWVFFASSLGADGKPRLSTLGVLRTDSRA
jgi:hypothetical protein